VKTAAITCDDDFEVQKQTMDMLRTKIDLKTLKMRRSASRISMLMIVCVLLQGCAEAIVVGGAVALVSYYDRRPIKSQIGDQAIELRVGKAISKDSELVNQTKLTFSCYNATVLLVGEVPDKKLKQHAMHLVQSVKGVKRVHDEVTVGPPRTTEQSTEDGAITRRVKSRLFIKDIDATKTKVVTVNGQVYLMGLVTHKEAQAITDVVGTTDGVKKVIKYFEYVD